MDDYKIEFQQLKEEYQSYQKITEEKIQELSVANMQYQQNLDMLSNVILISNYVNSNLSSKNIIPMINDMILGIIGVTQSTIYLLEDFRFVIKATNGTEESIKLTKECTKHIGNHKTFIINSKEPIVELNDSGKSIHSRMGVPIKVREKFMGYIVVDHTHYNFLTDFHEIFLSSIASQIAIALENSILYTKIEKAARCDALIGIYNRKTFYEIIEEKLIRKKDRKYAIVMIDLDDFKKVNDTLGHQFGDAVLIETVNVMRDMLTPKDIIARYGGEEIILYIDCKKNFDGVYKKVNALRKAVANNIISKDGESKSITASFGLSFYPKDGETIEEIIKCADDLLYEAKHAGKNTIFTSYLIE